MRWLIILVLSITASSLTAQITVGPNPGAGIEGDYYSHKFLAVGGAAPHTFYLSTSSTLPTGLTLGSTGWLTGTPSVSGNYSFTVIAVDSVNTTGGINATMSVIDSYNGNSDDNDEESCTVSSGTSWPLLMLLGLLSIISLRYRLVSKPI